MKKHRLSNSKQLWFMVSELAFMLGLSDVTIRRMVKDGRIPALRVGGKIVVRGDVVDRIKREGIPARERADRRSATKEA